MCLKIGNGDETQAIVKEIERHLHNREKWFGLAGTPSGETHRADRMAGGVSPFQLVAGNNAFGSWVQIIGSDDTPVHSDMTKMDAHRVMVIDTNSINPFITQLIAGESSEIAALLAAEEFTEFPYISQSNLNDSGISEILTRRATSGVKVWARTCCIGGNGNTIDFYIGVHEYLV